MGSRFYTYALAQALSEAGDDYVDTFVPFLLAAMPPETEPAELGVVQRQLAEKFSLAVPEAVLDTIATRAKRRGFLTQQDKTLQLTDAGQSFRGKLEPEADVSRRINALLADISTFFGSKDHTLTEEQAETLLLDFLRSNVEPLMEFMGGAGVDQVSLKTDGAATEQERLLVDYVRAAEAAKPEHFETLRQMVLGALVTTVLQSQEPEELIELRRRKLRELSVYLDTNFLFSVLELHPDEFAKPALELFKLFKTCGLRPKVFSFTVDEACRVLGGYVIGAYRYPANVRIDTLYSALRTRGWTKFQVQEYIAHIEEVLEHLGIEVEPVAVNLKSYEAPDADRVSLARYKPEQPPGGQSHDLAAVSEIQRVRGRTIRKFEDAKAFFLTSDIRLSRYCHKELGHGEHGTIAEVILDRLLTNVLWLKNPGIEAPLRMVIAAYSRDLFVKRRVWDRFYEVLKQVHQTGKVSDERIAGLFYRNYIEDVLLEFDDTEVKITEDFVLQQIEKASQQRDEVEVAKLQSQESEFLQRLGKAVDETEEARDKEWTERLESIRASVRSAVERRSKKIAAWTASLGTLAAGAVAVGLFIIAEKNKWTEPIQFFLPLFVGGSGIFALWKFLYRAVEKRYVRRKYVRRLKEAGLAAPVSQPNN